MMLHFIVVVFVIVVVVIVRTAITDVIVGCTDVTVAAVCEVTVCISVCVYMDSIAILFIYFPFLTKEINLE